MGEGSKTKQQQESAKENNTSELTDSQQQENAGTRVTLAEDGEHQLEGQLCVAEDEECQVQQQSLGECQLQQQSLGERREDRMQQPFLLGVQDCIPTVLGYLSIGFAAGVIGKTAGQSVLEIVLMSLLVYAGSAQFIMSGMLATGSPGPVIAMTVFLVNLRHLLMSAAMAPYFRHLPVWKNVVLGAQLTDETFGVASTLLPTGQRAGGRWMLGLNVTAHLNWVLATGIGAWCGAYVTDPGRYGLYYALPGMFIGLLALQLLARSKWRIDLIVAGTAVAGTLLASFWLSSSVSVLVAVMAAATVGMMVEAWR